MPSGPLLKIKSPVRSQGHDLFIELGPGKVLAGLMARIDKEAKIISIDDASSLEVAVEELHNF